MEYSKLVDLFQDETTLLLEKYELNDQVENVKAKIEKLKNLNEKIGKLLIKELVKVVSKGTVTTDIIKNNFDELDLICNTFKENKFKEYLNVNVQPELYLSEDELNSKIVFKFSEKLMKTEELKKEEESLNDFSGMGNLFGSLMGKTPPPGFRAKPTSKKYKVKKKKKK